MEIVHASDRSVLVQLGEHDRVVSLARRLESSPPTGVTSFSPAYSSVLIRYDPSAIHTDALEKWLHDSGSEFPAAVQEHRSFVLPAVFDGPDLQELAESAGLSPARVVDLFCSREYRVYSLGFVPGFAYMGAVPSRIAKPRRAVPRTTVPAGSVGIAGEQTGIYPSATPGGWNLIGRCFVRLFDPNRDPACLLRTGDSVRFQPA